MNVHPSNTLPIIEAISEGKSVLAYNFSMLDEKFLDVYVVLPSIKEAKVLRKLISKKYYEADVELTILHKYVLTFDSKHWLVSDAPAGLLTSLCSSLLSCALPESAQDIQTLINVTRNSVDALSDMTNILVSYGLDKEAGESFDIYDLISTAVGFEKRFNREQILEEGWKIQTVKQNQPGHMIDHGVINTQEANKELAKA